MLIFPDAYLVILALLFIIISLYTEFIGASFTFVIAVTFLGFVRILTPSEILSGLANEQIAIIIMMLLVGDIYRQTGVLTGFFDKVFKHISASGKFRNRMMLIVAFFSAFMNNTPLVALMMPYVHVWSKKHGKSVSKFLLPLSFAAILGGTMTLIGTSTNLIVSGLLIDQTILPDIEPLGIFEFVYVGLPMTILGIIYLSIASNKLLPERKDMFSKVEKDTRKYIVEVEVRPGYELIGKTLKDTDFYHTEGLTLVEIIRSDNRAIPPSPNIVIFENDVFIFAGNVSQIADIVHANPNLVIPSLGMYSHKSETQLIEIFIAHNSLMAGKQLNDINFRKQFDATVIAIHRNGEVLSGKTGDVILKAGDALLILAGTSFKTRALAQHDFFVVSNVREFHKLGFLRTLVLIGGTFLVILLSALGVIKLFMGLIVLLMLSLILKIASPKELPKSIDYNLALIIALSLSLGIAMTKTGVAEFIAQNFIHWFLPLGNLSILFGIYLITTILAAFITNKAAVALIFPIAITMSKDLNIPPHALAILVAYAAAANFMTPIGYQTNLMVYGPGGYKFRDFIKIGTPLTILYMIVSVLIIYIIYF